MKVQVYKKSATKDVHIQAISDFYEGIVNQGDEAELIEDSTVDSTTDTYVFFGSWKDRKRPWHQLKMKIVGLEQPFIVMETPIIGREIRNDHPYYRIGVDHYVRHLGHFNNYYCSAKRWEQMREDLGIEVKPWRSTGKYILLCLQIPGDASLLGEDITDWALQTIRQLRKVTDRPIRCRPHPIPRKYDEETVKIIHAQPGVKWIEPDKQKSLEEDLSDAWATVTYTSGVGVDSILAGVPVVGCHPGNFAYPISSTIEQIEDPNLPDRTDWLSDIAYVQWSLDEIQRGDPWRHLRPEIEKRVDLNK